MNNTTIQTRIDPDSKEKLRDILDDLGISMSEAIVMYIHQIILRKGIPFEVKLPNKTTLDTVEALENGKELHSVSNSDELLRELHS